MRRVSSHAVWLSPETNTWPMCEMSKMPAEFLTAACSVRMEEYWTGMDHPPKGMRRAPRARWADSRGEWRTSSDTG